VEIEILCLRVSPDDDAVGQVVRIEAVHEELIA